MIWINKEKNFFLSVMTPRYFSFKGSRLKQYWFYISNVQKFLHATFLCDFLKNRSKSVSILLWLYKYEKWKKFD